ncbi:drug resistance transporter, EmrB/QacA subfamily [Parafrankia irregularis]|uniref:Drug resistance transporter, EmrB/QacA subfamily n=2 Tax=Frankiaceae TaxID=74712 RepID=A0A0S4QIV1_9ACTN|nr:multidrug efflux MFS transporter [Parafrankia sp. CH37]CUU55161.1 drug resistance transporter, EmrB/QacA subfamily [Parafrankia irregularis]
MSTSDGTATASQQGPVASDRIDPAVWRMAITVIVGALAVILDTTIVSVAINDLTRELDTSLSTIQWVSTGYLLAMFVTIPVAGWAQSVLGGKRLWIAALGIFLLGSVLCAAAWDVHSLIVFRVVQGIGGGIIMPLMITLIMQAARGGNIGKVMATISLPAALGPILGPVLGGVILHVGDWRWMFFVNIPFCVVGAWLAARNLPDDRPRGGTRARLDVLGLLLISPGVAAVIFGLSRVEGSAGFASVEVLLPLLVGLALIAAFVGWALARSTAALVDLRLLRHRPLASSAAVGFVLGGALYGSMLLLPLFWQQARGEDALGAGLLLIPQGVGTLFSRNLAGRYTDRYGPRWVALTGFALACVATLPFAFVTAGTGDVPLLAALFVRGLGLGAATIPLAGAAYIGLGHAEIPHASVITRVGQQIGGSLGTAVLAVVLQHTAGGAHTPEAVADAFGEAFWWSIAFTAVAVPLCLLLPGRPTAPFVPESADVDAEVAAPA